MHSSISPAVKEEMLHGTILMLDVQFGQVSDFGKVRTNNEDAMGSFIPTSRRQARSHGYLFAVADGVGGMDFGEVGVREARHCEFAPAFGRSPWMKQRSQ